MAFSVFEDYNLITYGIIKIKGKNLEDKLQFASEQIEELINKHHVNAVILEDVYYSKNFTSTKSTLQMMGALKLKSLESGAVVSTVQATKWRKGVIKKSTRDTMKKQAVDYVNEFYGLDLKHSTNRAKSDDDMAEAIIMVEGLVWKRYTLDSFIFHEDKG